MSPSSHGRARQRGIVLISALLLLVLVTIMALSIFRSFGLQEKIAGNVRDKQRATQVATSAQEYAEWWLSNVSSAPLAVSSGSAASAATTCAGIADANLGTSRICNLPLVNAVPIVTTVPWSIGTLYTPLATMNIGSPTLPDNYFARPAFYIADVGVMPSGGELYKVDAYSYGSSGTTVSVVESTVSITAGVINPGKP